MTTELAQKVGLKLFERNLEQYTPADPLYEEYIDKKGKKKRRRVCSLLYHSAPPGLSKLWLL